MLMRPSKTKCKHSGCLSMPGMMRRYNSHWAGDQVRLPFWAKAAHGIKQPCTTKERWNEACALISRCRVRRDLLLQYKMMLEVRNVPGRGRGLFTTRLVKAGEDLLVESPMLLTVSQDAKETACAHCLKQLSPATGKPPPPAASGQIQQ
jgi:hypothetical protein